MFQWQRFRSNHCTTSHSVPFNRFTVIPGFPGNVICPVTSISDLPHSKDFAPPSFHDEHEISKAFSFGLDPEDWDEMLSPIHKGIREIFESRESPSPSQTPGYQDEAFVTQKRFLCK